MGLVGAGSLCVTPNAAVHLLISDLGTLDGVTGAGSSNLRGPFLLRFGDLCSATL